MRPSRCLPVAALLAVPLLTGGCGLGAALGVPVPSASGSASPAPATTAAVSTAAVAAPATPSTPPPDAGAELRASTTGRPGSLAVWVAPPDHALPSSWLADHCGLTEDATEYAEVTVRFVDRGGITKQEGVSSNLRLDLSVPPGVGVFVQDRAESIEGCNGGTVLPTRAELQTLDLAGEHQDMTVYVVARTTAAAPDPLAGVTLEVDDLRRHPDDISATPWTWHVSQVTAGSACPGEADSLCVPLA